MAEIRRLHNALLTYFTPESIFTLETLIGNGLHALTSRVGYKDPQSGKYKRFVVKQMRRNNRHDIRELKKEKGWLKKLSHARHIVNLVADLPDNPLGEPSDDRDDPHGDDLQGNDSQGDGSQGDGSQGDDSQGDDPSGGGDQEDSEDEVEVPIADRIILMEWLEHGTLGDFITRIRTRPKPLPNRLLWRFLGCSMAYPPDRPPPVGSSQRSEALNYIRVGEAARPSLLQHNDLHDSNTDMEHNIAPILKLIDFGSAVELPSLDGDPLYGVRSNLIDVGFIMCGIILRKRWREIWPSAAARRVNFVPRDGETPIQTRATPLYSMNGSPDPWPASTDPDLKRLVSLMMARDKTQRPDLGRLLDEVMPCILRRNASYYDDAEEEDGANIKELWRSILLEPPQNSTAADPFEISS
ncbi:hypothetical protein JX265_006669 [Neoarthrinium moseri]|uniref:Protein kinase domain-containing protein n=1 Tax=Neoarthrinium moseri TaxID=1658444 RepID=A0A9P9WLN9_9PEZI|nr:hypothetical protein JX265_006669 [Neoarthrinium moseri]